MGDRLQADARFAVMPEWVLFHPDLTHAAIRVYGAIVRHAGPDGNAWPSMARLSRKCHCSPDTVRRAIDQLEDVGALEVEPRFEDGRQTSNLYTVFATPPADRGEGGTHARGGVAPVQGGRVAPMQGEEREPEEREPLKSLSSGDDGEDGELPYTMSHVEAFDVLAEACRLDADGIRKVGGGLIGRNAKIIRDLRVSKAEVLARADSYRRKHPDWDLTPAALVKWWPTLQPAAAGVATCECGQPLNSHSDMAHDALMED